MYIHLTLLITIRGLFIECKEMTLKYSQYNKESSMEKIAKLKSLAKSLTMAGAVGILGAGAGISAEKQIVNNKNNTRSKKGWDTRRKNVMSKKANEMHSDSTHEAKQLIRSIGTNVVNPKHAAIDYFKRKLITKIRMNTSKDIRNGIG